MNNGRIKQNGPLFEVVDLFCGIGGLSYGLKSKGFVIKGGFDIDGTCRYAYEHNNEASFFNQDINNLGTIILYYIPKIFLTTRRNLL